MIELAEKIKNLEATGRRAPCWPLVLEGGLQGVTKNVSPRQPSGGCDRLDRTAHPARPLTQLIGQALFAPQTQAIDRTVRVSIMLNVALLVLESITLVQASFRPRLRVIEAVRVTRDAGQRTTQIHE